MLLAVILSIGAINALVPIIIIIVLIAAAAGATRGFSLFNVFGIATLLGGTGSVGGASRGSAARTGFTLRTYLDPGKAGAQLITRPKMGRTKGPAGGSVFSRVKVVAAAATKPSSRRVERLNLREGERQSMVAGSAVGKGGAGRVKMAVAGAAASATSFFGNQKAAFKPTPTELKPGRQARMVEEKEYLEKQLEHINETKGQEKQVIKSLMAGLAAKEKELESANKDLGELEKRTSRDNKMFGRIPSEAEKQADKEEKAKLSGRVEKLQTECNNMKLDAITYAAGSAAIEKRLGELNEHIGRVNRASERLSSGEIGEAAQKRIFAESMNRLYGPPDRSTLHNIFNPNYGTGPGSATAALTRSISSKALAAEFSRFYEGRTNSNEPMKAAIAEKEGMVKREKGPLIIAREGKSEEAKAREAIEAEKRRKDEEERRKKKQEEENKGEES